MCFRLVSFCKIILKYFQVFQEKTILPKWMKQEENFLNMVPMQWLWQRLTKSHGCWIFEVVMYHFHHFLEVMWYLIWTTCFYTWIPANCTIEAFWKHYILHQKFFSQILLGKIYNKHFFISIYQWVTSLINCLTVSFRFILGQIKQIWRSYSKA